MIETTITSAELHARLARAGQLPAADPAGGEPPDPSDTGPSPETIVTVAATLDPVLRPEYRSRYYACLLRSPEDPVPVLRDDPAFALPGPFLRAAADGPAGDPFLDGPVRWLVARLARFDRVLLWPGSPAGTLGIPAVAAGAVSLDLRREADCRTFWEAAGEASRGVHGHARERSRLSGGLPAAPPRQGRGVGP